MVFSKKPAGEFFSFRFRSTLLLLGCTAGLPQLAHAQQSTLHFPLLPKVIAELDTGSDHESEAYLSRVSKQPASFRPTPSDLLIGKAEEKFQAGKRAFQIRDIETARKEFDAAVDLLLMASDNPSDRRLYESKVEEMVESIHRYDLAGLGAGAPPEEVQFERAPLDNIIQMTFPVDPRIKGKVLEEVKATSSQLPLTVNDAVLSYINYFSGRGHRTMVAGLERAGRYRPMVAKILAEEGVPQELIHLAQAESGFLPRAVSYRAAVGMWQFVQFRGREYGLAQTSLTDDRLDPEKATRAAARHLHDLYNRYGDWYLAIAAYNCGPGTIDKAVERTGYADFWELRSRHVIPAETTNYVPIILAMTIMTKNAAEYGLADVTPEPALDYDTVEVSSLTHLALVGDITDTPVSQLVQMNPALIRNLAPGGYTLRVPRGAGDSLRATLNAFPAERRASWRMHRVESGETLTAIAKRYNTAVSSIEHANRIADAGPYAGDRLIIPAVYHETASAVRGSSKRSMLSARSHARRTLASAGRSPKSTAYASAHRSGHKLAMSRVAAHSHRTLSRRRA